MFRGGGKGGDEGEADDGDRSGLVDNLWCIESYKVVYNKRNF